MKATELIKNHKTKSPKAINAFAVYYLKKKGIPCIDADALDLVESLSETMLVNDLKSYLFDFFNENEIITTIIPKNISFNKETKVLNTSCIRYDFTIWVDGFEITERDFKDRGDCELLVIYKSFMFLETKLNILFHKERFFDESANYCPLKINYDHYNHLLSHNLNVLYKNN